MELLYFAHKRFFCLEGKLSQASFGREAANIGGGGPKINISSEQKKVGKVGTVDFFCRQRVLEQTMRAPPFISLSNSHTTKERGENSPCLIGARPSFQARSKKNLAQAKYFFRGKVRRENAKVERKS